MSSNFAWARIFVGVCLVLPWLNSIASGPSASVQSWLLSVVCVAFAFAVQRAGAIHPLAAAALIGLGAWSVLRSSFSPETLALSVTLLLVFMAAAMTAGAQNQPAFARTVGLGWVAAASISTAIALIQYFGLADHFASWVSGSAAGEAYANLRQRNQYATLTVIGMASLLWLSRPGLTRWPAVAAMAWLAIGNGATTSRTGLVQLMLLGVLVCVWSGPRRDRAVLWFIALLAYVLAAVALPWLLEMASGTAGNRLWDRVASVEACSSRAVLWSNVLDLIALHPWAGWGWGELDYAHFVTLYQGPRFCDILDNAHNLPLHLAVELGIPAALLLCGCFLWAMVRAKPWRERDPACQLAWAVLAVIGLHSLLEYPLWYGPFQIALGLCLGLLWPRTDPGIPSPVTPAIKSRLAGALGVCVVLGCLYAGWDYHRVSQIYLPPEARTPALRDDPLSHMRNSWLFRKQVEFAEVTITPLTQANAAWTLETARTLLHYSPEPRVIEKVIEAALVLGREDEVLLNLARYRAAFPDAYQEWARARARTQPAAREGQHSASHVMSRLAALLLQQSHARDHHCPVDRLAHVINREQANLHRRKGLHFHPGRSSRLDLRGASHKCGTFRAGPAYGKLDRHMSEG